MFPKFTLKVNPDYTTSAISFAHKFLRDHAPKSRYQCVCYALQRVDTEQYVATFAAWGDEKHVRVYQSEG
jgi:hypothetical protein